MKKRTILGTAFIACGILLLNSCASIPKNAKPVENFDVNRYLGAWYEIARFDFRFEKDLNNTSAQYKLYIIIEKGSSFYLKSIPFRKDFQRT